MIDIEAIMNKAGKFTPEDAEMLAKEIGDYDPDYNFERDGDFWQDSVLNGYAEYIQNYLYNYKNEATALDPSIDPNEDQIGPMAQDIEQVNPACIVETDDGTKEVDTRKLALMNAGAIADLARKVEELAKMIGAK